MTAGRNLSLNFIKLIICIVICEGTGGLSALLSGTANNEWYQSLSKPSWNPPPYIFGPVWIVLYLMIAIALWRLWTRENTPQRRKATFLFAAQLFLNFWWSIIFFRFHLLGWALLEIIVLWLLINATIFAAAPLCRKSSWLMVPYVCWVSFAALLNYAIYILNTP